MARFPNGARVAFIGDSIVAENLALQRIIDYYEKNFQGSDIRFFNCGIAGGTAESALRYFDKDIKRHRPTHAVIATGVNDSQRELLNTPRSSERTARLKAAYEKYKRDLPSLVERLLSEGVEVILCTPIPYDEHTTTDEAALCGGYALMLGYADFVRNYAQRNGIPLCDHYEYFQDLIQVDTPYSSDHIHPNERGYYHLAASFLRYQGLDIGEMTPIPQYLHEWASRVTTLRTIFAAEYMLIKDLTMNDEQKLAYMRDKVAKEDWGQPVFEKFYRAFVAHKANEATLFCEIDEHYESDIIGHYSK